MATDTIHMFKPSRMEPSVHPSSHIRSSPLLSFMEDLWTVRTCFYAPCVSGNVGRASALMCVLFMQNQQLLFVSFLPF